MALTDDGFHIWDFTSEELRNVSFECEDLYGERFECADLYGANFRGANLENASFEFANLSEVNFSNTYLYGTYFRNAKMNNINFRCATFLYTKLPSVHKNANFSFAKFVGIDFYKSEFDNVNLYLSRLEDSYALKLAARI